MKRPRPSTRHHLAMVSSETRKERTTDHDAVRRSTTVAAAEEAMKVKHGEDLRPVNTAQ